MKRATAILGVLTTAALTLLGCGGSGGGSTPAPQNPRTLSFRMNWAGGGIAPQSARITLYSGNRALATLVVNQGTTSVPIPIPDGSVKGVRIHAEAFSATGAGGTTLGEVDAALPLSTVGNTEVTELSTAPVQAYEIEGSTAGLRVGETLELVAVPRDANGYLCLAPEPDWDVDNPLETSLTFSTLAIQPPGRSTDVATRRSARITRTTSGGTRISVGSGAAAAGYSVTYEDQNISPQATWEGTWTGILSDAREGYPPSTVYTTVISAPQGGRHPITWISSAFEPYRFSYEATLVGNSLSAFAGEVTLTRDGESLVVAQPNAQQNARLRRTNRAINLKGKVVASRRIPSGNVELDLVLINESSSTISGIELENVTLGDFGPILGDGSSGWTYGTTFGSLGSGDAARRTLTFPSNTPSGAANLSFGINTLQGTANYMELRVSVVPVLP